MEIQGGLQPEEGQHHHGSGLPLHPSQAGGRVWAASTQALDLG